MKKIFLVCLILFCMPIVCSAETDAITQQYEATGADAVFDIASDVFPGFDSRALVEQLSTGTGFDTGSILKNLLSFFMGAFKDNLRICVLVVVVGFITGLFSTMQSSFGGKGASECGFLVGYCIFAGILTAAFSNIITPAQEMLEMVSAMIQATIPILLTLLTFGGGVVSSALLAQALIALVNIINSVITGLVMPLILCSFGLSVAANMSDRLNLSHTILIVRKSVKWILLFLMAIFAGVFSVYGLSGSAIDASAGKAVRFAIGSGIPIVGGVAADSLETVIATLGATRNIVGTVGMCAIVALAAAPVLKTAALMWIFRLCCVVIEPFSDRRAVKLVSDAAECITLVFAVLISVCLIFIAALGVLLVTGNFIVR